MEANALGPERESRYTRIIVTVADHKYPNEGEYASRIDGDEKKRIN